MKSDTKLLLYTSAIIILLLAGLATILLLPTPRVSERLLPENVLVEYGMTQPSPLIIRILDDGTILRLTTDNSIDTLDASALAQLRSAIDTEDYVIAKRSLLQRLKEASCTSCTTSWLIIATPEGDVHVDSINAPTLSRVLQP